jgi:hypothetical protein
MITISRTAFVVLCVLIPTAVFADGLIYQLPGDGTWARFDIDRKATPPDGKESTMIGSLTLSSVGAAEVDGEPCRWIEIAIEMKKDGLSATVIHKLRSHMGVHDEGRTEGTIPGHDDSENEAVGLR